MKKVFKVKVSKVFIDWVFNGESVTEGSVIEIEESPSVTIKDNLILDWEYDSYGFHGVKGEILETLERPYDDFEEVELWMKSMV